MAYQLGFLRLYVHDWTRLTSDMWAARIHEIVERREFYEEPGSAGEQWQWAISDPEVVVTADDMLISGILHKIRKNAADRVWDMALWNVRRGVPGVLAAENSVPFTISVKHHIIAHVVTVSQAQFVSIFREILQRNGASAPGMNRLVDKKSFFEQIDRFERVTTVRAQVHPTNPIDKEAVAKADGLLKQLRAAHGTFVFRSEQGLNMDRNELLRHLLNLAAEGYGRGTVYGVERETGIERRVSTKDKGIRIPVDPLTLADLRHMSVNFIPQVADAEDEPVRTRKRRS